MRQGRNLRGGMQCFTVRVSLPSGMPGSTMATWRVLRLTMLEAPDQRHSEGLAALEHMIRTHQIDPRWAQMQQGTVAAQSQIISQSNREISQIIADGFEQRQAHFPERLAQDGLVDPCLAAELLEDALQAFRQTFEHRGTRVRGMMSGPAGRNGDYTGRPRRRPQRSRRL